jgi:hypothetical protein
LVLLAIGIFSFSHIFMIFVVHNDKVESLCAVKGTIRRIF